MFVEGFVGGLLVVVVVEEGVGCGGVFEYEGCGVDVDFWE